MGGCIITPTAVSSINYNEHKSASHFYQQGINIQWDDINNSKQNKISHLTQSMDSNSINKLTNDAFTSTDTAKISTLNQYQRQEYLLPKSSLYFRKKYQNYSYKFQDHSLSPQKKENDNAIHNFEDESGTSRQNTMGIMLHMSPQNKQIGKKSDRQSSQQEFSRKSSYQTYRPPYQQGIINNQNEYKTQNTSEGRYSQRSDVHNKQDSTSCTTFNRHISRQIVNKSVDFINTYISSKNQENTKLFPLTTQRNVIVQSPVKRTESPPTKKILSSPNNNSYSYNHSQKRSSSFNIKTLDTTYSNKQITSVSPAAVRQTINSNPLDSLKSPSNLLNLIGKQINLYIRNNFLPKDQDQQKTSMNQPTKSQELTAPIQNLQMKINLIGIKVLEQRHIDLLFQIISPHLEHINLMLDSFEIVQNDAQKTLILNFKKKLNVGVGNVDTRTDFMKQNKDCSQQFALGEDYNKQANLETISVNKVFNNKEEQLLLNNQEDLLNDVKIIQKLKQITEDYNSAQFQILDDNDKTNNDKSKPLLKEIRFSGQQYNEEITKSQTWNSNKFNFHVQQNGFIKVLPTINSNNQISANNPKNNSQVNCPSYINKNSINNNQDNDSHNLSFQTPDGKNQLSSTLNLLKQQLQIIKEKQSCSASNNTISGSHTDKINQAKINPQQIKISSTTLSSSLNQQCGQKETISTYNEQHSFCDQDGSNVLIMQNDFEQNIENSLEKLANLSANFADNDENTYKQISTELNNLNNLVLISDESYLKQFTNQSNIFKKEKSTSSPTENSSIMQIKEKKDVDQESLQGFKDNVVKNNSCNLGSANNNNRQNLPFNDSISTFEGDISSQQLQQRQQQSLLKLQQICLDSQPFQKKMPQLQDNSNIEQIIKSAQLLIQEDNSGFIQYDSNKKTKQLQSTILHSYTKEFNPQENLFQENIYCDAQSSSLSNNNNSSLLYNHQVMSQMLSKQQQLQLQQNINSFSFDNEIRSNLELMQSKLNSDKNSESNKDEGFSSSNQTRVQLSQQQCLQNAGENNMEKNPNNSLKCNFPGNNSDHNSSQLNQSVISHHTSGYGSSASKNTSYQFSINDICFQELNSAKQKDIKKVIDKNQQINISYDTKSSQKSQKQSKRSIKENKISQLLTQLHSLNSNYQKLSKTIQSELEQTNNNMQQIEKGSQQQRTPQQQKPLQQINRILQKNFVEISIDQQNSNSQSNNCQDLE